jgi:thiamine kinase-like enzyme
MTSVPAALRSETTKQEYTQLAQMYLASINDELTELSSALSNLRENPSETSTIRELIRELETKMDKLNQTKKSVQSILTKIESSTAELMITPEEKMLILAGNDKS